MVLLYASRACYNLAALALAPRSRLDAFDYDWYNVSDQVGIGHGFVPSLVTRVSSLHLCRVLPAWSVQWQAVLSLCSPPGRPGE